MADGYQLVPVDHDPMGFVSVDHDPFSATSFEQRLPDVQGAVEDRRGENFTPWQGVKAALADDASFFAEKLGLKRPPDVLPAGKGNSPLAREAGYGDIGKHPDRPGYVLKPEDDQRGMLERTWDAYVDAAHSALQPPESWRWPDRERTRPRADFAPLRFVPVDHDPFKK